MQLIEFNPNFFRVLNNKMLHEELEGFTKEHEGNKKTLRGTL